MDLFKEKNKTPMLIGEMQDAFNSDDYIFELKLDGVRCLAYLDQTAGTELRNKRHLRVTSIYPELADIHKQIKKRCVLDGELVVIGSDGKPDFSEMKRRALMHNDFKIKLASAKLPVSFVAFDILYLDGQQLTDLPLMERKKQLESTVKENEQLAISRYIEEKGTQLYALAKQQNLEGIVNVKTASIILESGQKTGLKSRICWTMILLSAVTLKNKIMSSELCLGSTTKISLSIKGT